MMAYYSTKDFPSRIDSTRSSDTYGYYTESVLSFTYEELQESEDGRHHEIVQVDDQGDAFAGYPMWRRPICAWRPRRNCLPPM